MNAYSKRVQKSDGNSDVCSQPAQRPTKCSNCNSTKIWKDGLRKTDSGDIQRYLCRECGFRFSVSGFAKSFYTESSKGSSYQIGAVPNAHGQVKNLVVIEPLREGYAGATTEKVDSKGKIVEHAWWLKKQGYKEATIIGKTKLLKIMVKKGANLYDPETIKEVIAEQTWSEGRKENAVNAYTTFLKMTDGTWNPPNYSRIRKLPFIPTEQEIDMLIASCTIKAAALLQTLKETGARVGEAWTLKWTDLDNENRTIRITPEKGSNPRIFKISPKLHSMLQLMPKKGNCIFGNYPLNGYRTCYTRQRKKAARKLGNPRLLQITFHTFRHWKATMEYHKTKDILHVMRILGHKNIKNTLVYTQLIEFKEDEFVCKAAKTVKEAMELIENSFEFVCAFDNVKMFRKRK